MKNDKSPPRTEADRAWQRAEAFASKLAETGDTPRSFFIKGAIGLLQILALVGLCIWALVALVRVLLS